MYEGYEDYEEYESIDEIARGEGFFIDDDGHWIPLEDADEYDLDEYDIDPEDMEMLYDEGDDDYNEGTDDWDE